MASQTKQSEQTELEITLQGNKFVVVAIPSCFLEFVMEDNVMNMIHTFVDIDGRGQGLAGKLCMVAFKHCQKEKLQVKPSCTYISGRFLIKHPEFAGICVEQ